MLPYIEQGPLYNSFNASIGMEGLWACLGFIVNSTVFTTKIASFQCPSDNVQTFSISTVARRLGGSSRLHLVSHQGKLRHQLG